MTRRVRPREHRAHAASRISPALISLLLAITTLSFTLSKAQAMRIQELLSSGGISVWLVEEHTVPLIAMRFAFDGGGSSQDPVGKEGLANFLSSMLDEGAGDLPAKRFQERSKTRGKKAAA